MSGNSVQTLKSAREARVKTDQAERLYTMPRAVSNGLFCPASAGDLSYDVYGRQVTQNTLDLRDSPCSHYTGISTDVFMDYENAARPYVPICSAGMRGNGDTGSLGRDLNPRDLYDDSGRGGWIKMYNTRNNIQPDTNYLYKPRNMQVIRPFDYSIDSTSNLYYRG
jgi:hypothetical protein